MLYFVGISCVLLLLAVGKRTKEDERGGGGSHEMERNKGERQSLVIGVLALSGGV